VEKRKAAKEIEEIGGKHGHHGRGYHHRLAMADTTARGVHHSQAVVASGHVGLPLPERCVFGCRFALWVLPWIIRLGPIGLVLLALLTWFGLNFSIFS